MLRRLGPTARTTSSTPSFSFSSSSHFFLFLIYLFYRTLNKLALMFQENFKDYESRSSDAVKAAGPTVDAHAESIKIKISKEL